MDILEELWNTDLRYKGITVNFFGFPRFREYNPRSLRSTYYRLKKNKFISENDCGISITKAGQTFLENNQNDLINFTSPFKKNEPKNLLLMFDVPIEKNKYRDWLRRQLKEFGYIMVQQSVWIGPSPLPKDFKAYVKEIGIQKSIRTFKLAKTYIK